MKNEFTGFPNSTFKFLQELKKNNERPWFNENKERYLNDVLEPSLRFIEAMDTRLKKLSPHFLAIAKRTGGSLMRIYRDTRFSKDKTPYKTNIGIHFRHEFGKDVHAPGYYMHVEPGRAYFGAGIWRPDRKTLTKIRTHIVEYERDWKRVSRSKKLTEAFEFSGESLKRPPRDFESDHPFIEDIKRKDFIAIAPLQFAILKTPAIIDEVCQQIKASSHYIAFLCNALKIPS